MQKQKIYKEVVETSSEKKKINTKQKTRVRTHSWDEKKDYRIDKKKMI